MLSPSVPTDRNSGLTQAINKKIGLDTLPPVLITGFFAQKEFKEKAHKPMIKWHEEPLVERPKPGRARSHKISPLGRRNIDRDLSKFSARARDNMGYFRSTTYSFRVVSLLYSFGED